MDWIGEVRGRADLTRFVLLEVRAAELSKAPPQVIVCPPIANRKREPINAIGCSRRSSSSPGRECEMSAKVGGRPVPCTAEVRPLFAAPERSGIQQGLPRLDGRLFDDRSQEEDFMFNASDAATRLSAYCGMRHEHELGTTIIRLSGEFDLSSEERFQSELGLLLDSDTQKLVLDLRGLSFIDSIGLRVLVQIHAQAREERFAFVILCGEGQVRGVMAAAGLDGVLPLVDSVGSVPASESPV
jgi:anti-sigma B factor antagonist